MQVPELEVMIGKLSSKKFFMVLTLQYVCLQMSAPDKWWWVPLVCATVTTLAAIAAQTYLDKPEGKERNGSLSGTSSRREVRTR